VQDRFIAVWGQMAGAWGISRTMAEVHALLYIGGQSLNTDDIMERLQISRGNASMSLRALMDWGIVERTHRRGDRKEYFRAEQDVWALFRAIVRQRVKREVDPLVASLYEIRDLIPAEATGKPAKRAKPATATPDAPARDGAATAAPDDAKAMREHAKRLDEMLDFFRTLERLAQGFVSPAGRGLQAAAVLLRRATDAGAPPKGDARGGE
jgi:DNA-binding transcriptional regulator GbsR (MarR family)